MSKKLLLVIGGVIALSLAASIIWAQHAAAPGTSFHINDHRIALEQAITPAEQQLGLSGRDNIDEDAGMLFRFAEEGRQSIWMKDMRFVIDVLWLDSDGRVVYIVDNMDPVSYPKTYQSPSPARFVLELHGSAIERFDITIGSQLTGL